MSIINEIILEDGQENPASIFVDENGKLKFKDRDSVSSFMSSLAAQGGVAKLIDAAHGEPSDTLPSEVVVYIDLDDMQLYKRTESGWGAGLELRGERGPRGSKIFQGPANPNVVPVIDSDLGDVYIETGVDATYERRLWKKINNDVSSLNWEHAGLPYGKDGNDGQDGRHGSKVYTGTQDPNLQQPVGSTTDDLYFELDNHQIWKKNQDNSWSTIGQTYKGADGQSIRGPRGYGIFVGNLNPNNSSILQVLPDLADAIIGDVYIELDSYKIWKKNRSKTLQNPNVEEWDAQGAPFKGTDGRNLFQGVGNPNNFTATSPGLPAGILNAKVEDLYLDTVDYQNWKVTAIENSKPVWVMIGASYRPKGLIQGKIDPNIFESLDVEEVENTIDYLDKLSDYYEVKAAKLNDIYLDVESHKIYYKNSQNTWEQKGISYAAKAVVLESSSYFIAYNSLGKVPSPSIATLIATQIKHEGIVEYEFSKMVGTNRIVLQRNALNTCELDFSEDSRFGNGDYFGTPYTIEVRTFEVSNSLKANTVVATDSLSILAGKEGSSVPQLVLSNPSIQFIQNEDGTIEETQYSSTITGNTIKMIIGVLSLDAINTELTLNDKNVFRVKINEISGISLYSHPTDTSNQYKLLKNSFVTNADGQQFNTYAKFFDSFGDRKQAFIEYKAYAKDSTGRDIEVLARQNFSVLKDGNTGAAAKLVNLISNRLTFNKNSLNVFEPADQVANLVVDVQGLTNNSITESNWSIRVFRTNCDFEVNPSLYLINFSSDKKSCTLTANKFQELLNTLINKNGTTVPNPTGSYAYAIEISVTKEDIKSFVTLTTVKNGNEAKIFVVALNTSTNSIDTTLNAFGIPTTTLSSGLNQIGDGKTLCFDDVKLSRGNIVSLNKVDNRTSFKILEEGKYKIDFYGSFYSKNTSDTIKNVTVCAGITKTTSDYSRFFPVREIRSTIQVPARIEKSISTNYYYTSDDKKHEVNDVSGLLSQTISAVGVITTNGSAVQEDLLNQDNYFNNTNNWNNYDILTMIGLNPTRTSTSFSSTTETVASVEYVAGSNSGIFTLSLTLYLKQNEVLRFKARTTENISGITTYLNSAGVNEETDTVISITKIS
jgi:hypothetical protein